LILCGVKGSEVALLVTDIIRIIVPTVFLKQYGAQRTGTNYLRILLQKNRPGACMLMHILGDKHSPPAPFDALWAAAQLTPDPPLAFVSSATFQHPSRTTSPANPRQREEVRRIAEPLTAAYLDQSLGFVITIKNPYAWAVSIARYEGRIGRNATLDPRLAGFVRDRCASFNQRYRSWFQLAAHTSWRTLVVRHEDLIRDPGQVLAGLDVKFGLRAESPFIDEPRVAPTTCWDNQDDPANEVPFDRSYYLEERYLARLSPEAMEAVTVTIDWELLRGLEYEPPPPSS